MKLTKISFILFESKILVGKVDWVTEGLKWKIVIMVKKKFLMFSKFAKNFFVLENL